MAYNKSAERRAPHLEATMTTAHDDQYAPEPVSDPVFETQAELEARAMAELHLPGSKQLWKMYVPLATAAIAALGVK
jgi:hypothetical protein